MFNKYLQSITEFKLEFKLVFIGMVFFSLIANSSANAGVDIISLETEFDIDGAVYYEVSVKCSGVTELRNLRKLADSRSKWCSLDAPKFCSKKKVAVARAICKNSDTAVAKVTEQSKEGLENTANSSGKTLEESTQRDQLLKEQIIIEAQRIEIENMRLRLVERELVLKKRKSTL